MDVDGCHQTILLMIASAGVHGFRPAFIRWWVR
jgi:hypothetical protein